MNPTAHSVAPEQVMAFLDHELSAAHAETVSAHLDRCAECLALAEQFRSTSLLLSGWKVQAAPVKLEGPVAELAAKACSGLKVGKATPFIRPSFWTWKQRIAGLGAAAMLLLIIAIAAPILMRRIGRTVPAEALMAPAETLTAAQERAQKAEAESPAPTPLPTLSAGGRRVIEERSNMVAVTQDQTAAPDKPGDATDSNGSVQGLGDRAAPSFPAAPMIARTVSLSIVVKDFAASRSSVDSILVRHHGYSAQLSVSTPENAPRGLQASLRIPAPELASAVADLKTLGRVENESQSGEEVTQQHADLVARLKNSRETEERFRTILRERTGNTADVLQVEEGIARVRGDIERMEAEEKALEHRVDFASVELQLVEEYRAQLNPPAASVSTRIHNAFVAGYGNAREAALGIALWFVEYAPALLIWLAILLLPVILVWRRYRKALANL
jgi:hypothetical protein